MLLLADLPKPPPWPENRRNRPTDRDLVHCRRCGVVLERSLGDQRCPSCGRHLTAEVA